MFLRLVFFYKYFKVILTHLQSFRQHSLHVLNFLMKRTSFCKNKLLASSCHPYLTCSISCKDLFTPSEIGSEGEKDQRTGKRDQRINDKNQRKLSRSFLLLRGVSGPSDKYKTVNVEFVHVLDIGKEAEIWCLIPLQYKYITRIGCSLLEASLT